VSEMGTRGTSVFWPLRNEPRDFFTEMLKLSF